MLAFLLQNQQFNGAGLHVEHGGALALMDSNVYENEANQWGGGLHIAGTAALTNVNVYENEAKTGSGGGLHIAGGTATLINVNLYANSAGLSVCSPFESEPILIQRSSKSYIRPNI